jgi:hypothetical protein
MKDKRPDGTTQPVIEGEFIRGQVTRAVRHYPLALTAPEPSFRERLFGPTRTLEYYADHFRQRAALDHAVILALDARALVLRKFHEVGQLPMTFAQDDQLRDLDFEYRSEQLLRAIAQEKAEAMKAVVAIERAQGQVRQYRHETTEESLAHEPSEFAEELKAKREMRRLRDEEIARVRRSRGSAKEKEFEINEINAHFDAKRMEG